MLEIQNACLVVVDVQGKLAQLMVDKESLFKNIRILIQAAKILDIPILWCQQVPESLGPTVPEIAELLAGEEPIDKACFSCCGEERFTAELNALGKEQVLLCGIEAHICVYQTAMDLMEGGLDVNGRRRTRFRRRTESRIARPALDRLSAEGTNVSSTEMVLYRADQDRQAPAITATSRGWSSSTASRARCHMTVQHGLSGAGRERGSRVRTWCSIHQRPQPGKVRCVTGGLRRLGAGRCLQRAAMRSRRGPCEEGRAAGPTPAASIFDAQTSDPARIGRKDLAVSSAAGRHSSTAWRPVAGSAGSIRRLPA
jgi:hypothetical protein